MQELFTQLTRAVDGAPGVALGASAVWGVLSILLSPCHLASIPLIVGFISGEPNMTSRRAFATSTTFAVGILITIALVGAVTAALGRMAGDLGGWVNYAVATVFFVVGLYLLDVIPLNFAGAGNVNIQKRGMLAAFVLGLVFGIALGPCTFAYMAPVLAATFKVASKQPLYAAGLLTAYGVGHCAVIALAGGSASTVQRYLKWSQDSSGAGVIKKVCGVLVIAGGLYLVYTGR
jgi:cytochrome c-type biogenesis protein